MDRKRDPNSELGFLLQMVVEDQHSHTGLYKYGEQAELRNVYTPIHSQHKQANKANTWIQKCCMSVASQLFFLVSQISGAPACLLQTKLRSVYLLGTR